MTNLNNDWQTRTRLLFDDDIILKLNQSHVLIAGLGGVGGFAAEMLCRAGIGKMTIIDGDQIQDSNRNRQLLALTSTVGERKAKIMSDRLLDINPELDLVVIDEFIRDERTNQILEMPYDYVIDAIDTLSPKIFFIRQALLKQHKLISSMGAGGKTDPLQIKVADFSETYQCNLARMLRKRLKNLGVRNGFLTVFSPEMADESAMEPLLNEPNKKTTVGTISYMPAIFGSVAASVVIRKIAGIEVELAQRPCRRTRMQNN